MSAHQGNSACRITVDPSDGDVLRLETKLALADIYRDATAVIDALGWDPDTDVDQTSIEVPLTSGHIQQLHKRRCDLLDTNLDLLEDIGNDAESLAYIMAEIHANRRSVEALNRILGAYTDTITT